MEIKDLEVLDYFMFGDDLDKVIAYLQEVKERIEARGAIPSNSK